MILTFALMSFSMIFFHSPTWGEATSIVAQVFGVAASGSIGLVGYAAQPSRFLPGSAWGLRSFVGGGAPGARG